MRDSCVGSFGATALVMMLLVRFFALHEIARSSTPFSAPFSNGLLVPLALIAGYSLSRLCSTLVLASLDYARVDGKAKALNNRLSAGDALAGAPVQAKNRRLYRRLPGRRTTMDRSRFLLRPALPHRLSPTFPKITP